MHPIRAGTRTAGLDPNRWERIDQALARLLDGRTVDLDAFSSEERALLDRLLESARGELPGLDTPSTAEHALGEALARAMAEQEGLAPGARIGAFRILERIGAGGMGVVFLAERAVGGFEQRVALKVLADTSRDPATLKLFERERRLLARLEHPGIARLIDGGVTESGRPWFAMDYIDGEPLIRYVERGKHGIETRLDLLLQACGALDHAHRQLILHRDIKPSNLLVTREGQVRLVDFGLGALLQNELEPTRSETTIAAGRMTPSFASPEQARGEPISVASEVYQLGLLLYRLISGCPPYRIEGSNAFQVATAIDQATVRSPSARWRDADAAERSDAFGESPAQLRRRVAGDLDNITLKALARSPDQRYASAAALADDLRRHRERLPVRARAATRRYRAGRFIQRHRAGVAAASGFVLLLGVSVTLLALQAGALQRERDRAVASAERSERLVESMAGMIRMSDAANPVEQLYSLGDLLDRYVGYVRTSLEQDPTVRSRLLGILGQALQGIDRWGRAREVLGESLRIHRQSLNPDAQAIVDLERLLAEAEAFDGDLEAAVERLDRLAALQRERSGPESLTLADTVHLRGFLRTYHAPRDSDEFNAGIEDLGWALARFQAELEPPDPRIAEALHSLGFKQYDSAEGMAMLQAGLSMTRELYGNEHATTATRMAELAFAQDLNGDPARAAEIAERAHAIHSRLRGETHPDTLTMLSNLASFQRAAGNLEQAVTLYRSLHDLRVQALPEDHLVLAYTAHGMGNALRDLGRLEESERWLREALRLCRIHDSRNEAVTRQNLARTLEASGRGDAAIAEQQRSVAAYRRYYGADAAPTRAARERLDAMLQRRTGR